MIFGVMELVIEGKVVFKCHYAGIEERSAAFDTLKKFVNNGRDNTWIAIRPMERFSSNPISDKMLNSKKREDFQKTAFPKKKESVIIPDKPKPLVRPSASYSNRQYV